MMKKRFFNNKVILVTGGTGSFGKKFTQIILDEYNPKKIIIFSEIFSNCLINTFIKHLSPDKVT